jgi:dTDP-4-dehydrorhamnose reductase
LGKDGQVGWELQRALSSLGELVMPDVAQVNLENLDQARHFTRSEKPDIIVNAAAYTAVDKAESEPDRAFQINAAAVRILSEEASRLGSWLVHYSTDYVFDGSKASPYAEDDSPRPLSVYGATKLAGEQAIREHCQRHLILRTSWVYALRGANFAKTMLRLAQERDGLKVVEDQHGAPTSAELLADVTAFVLYRITSNGRAADSLAGTYHVVASGSTSWCEYARYVLALAAQRGVPLKTTADRVQGIPTEAYPTAAARPKNSRLDTSKLRSTFAMELPHWQYHLERMLDELTSRGAA